MFSIFGVLSALDAFRRGAFARNGRLTPQGALAAAETAALSPGDPRSATLFLRNIRAELVGSPDFSTRAGKAALAMGATTSRFFLDPARK